MMRKILILSLMTFSLGLLAQSAAEEALILNQELEFLEDSVNSTQSALSINTLKTNGLRNQFDNDQSLERTYFSDTEEDVVSTRTSGPKRRGL